MYYSEFLIEICCILSDLIKRRKRRLQKEVIEWYDRSKIAAPNLFNLLLPFKMKLHLYLWEISFFQSWFDLTILVKSEGTYYTVLIWCSFSNHVKFGFFPQRKSTCMPNRSLRFFWHLILLKIFSLLCFKDF